MARLLYFIENRWLNILFECFGLMEILYPQRYFKLWGKLATLELAWEYLQPNRYQAEIYEYTWYLKINIITEEPTFTLYFEDKAVLSFNILPKTWSLLKERL